jgi:hypothetical protein
MQRFFISYECRVFRRRISSAACASRDALDPRRSLEGLEGVQRWANNEASSAFIRKTLRQQALGAMRLRWARLSEQIFRVDKWSVCRG